MTSFILPLLFYLFKKLYIHFNVSCVMRNCFSFHISAVFIHYCSVYCYVHSQFQIN